MNKYYQLYRVTDEAAAMDTLGVKKLRGPQKRIMPAVYDGRDVFVMLPTGGGKSLLYQLPALCEEEGVTLVISPLIALQQDQVLSLQKRGVEAIAINSHLSAQERREALDKLGDYSLVYLAPEQLQTVDFRRTIQSTRVNRIAVDESHMLPQSEVSFRPDYGKIGEFVSFLEERPQIMAVTATSTKADRTRIKDALGMKDVESFIFPVRRDNLHLSVKLLEPVKSKGSEKARLESSFAKAVTDELTDRKKNGQVIIYAPFKHRAKQIYRTLKAHGIKRLGLYTGDTKRQKRRKLVKWFKVGKIRVMVATSAFGLGIDVPHVRLIIHAGLPLSMDAYVQEIGRAGRNGKKAECVLFYADSDYSANKKYLERKSDPEELPAVLKRLYQLREITDTDSCLWRAIERYYGKKPGKRCHKCAPCRRKDL